MKLNPAVQRLGAGKLVAPEVACVVGADPVRAKAVARRYAQLYLGLRNSGIPPGGNDPKRRDNTEQAVLRAVSRQPVRLLRRRVRATDHRRGVTARGMSPRDVETS